MGAGGREQPLVPVCLSCLLSSRLPAQTPDSTSHLSGPAWCLGGPKATPHLHCIMPAWGGGLVASDWTVAQTSAPLASLCSGGAPTRLGRPSTARHTFSRCPETLSGRKHSLRGHPPLPAWMHARWSLSAAPWWAAVSWQTPQREKNHRESPVTLLASSGHCVSSLPPTSMSCALRGVAAPAPSLFLLPLFWACQECREIRGRGHRKCLHPSKDSSSCKWRELGEGRGRRKVVPPPRPARTSQPCRQKGSFSPALAHCECPLRGDAEGRSPVGSLAQAGLREARCLSCSLNVGSLQSRLSGDPAPEPLRKQVRSGGLSLRPPRGAPFSGGHPSCHPHQGRASAHSGLRAGACFPGTALLRPVQDGAPGLLTRPVLWPFSLVASPGSVLGRLCGISHISHMHLLER